MKSAADQSPLRFALLGDFERLGRSKNAGARTFCAAFDLLPYRLVEETYNEAFKTTEDAPISTSWPEETRALAICGLAIADTFQGNAAGGKARLEATLHSAPSAHLLTVLAKTWLFAEELADYDEARSLVGTVLDSQVRARSRLKLGAWMLNEGHRKAAVEELELALADEDSGWQAEIEATLASLSEGPNRLIIRSSADPRDLRWLQDKANRAATDRLRWLLGKEVETFGTRTFGDGAAEGSLFQSLEAQLDWAGATRLDRSLGETVASAILLSPNPNETEVIHALSRLVKAESSLSMKALRKNEYLLTRVNVQQLVFNGLKGGRSISRRAWHEFCDAIWHLLPEEVLAELIVQMPIPDGIDSGSVELRLMGKLFLANPALWTQRIRQVSSRQAVAAVLSLPRMVSWLADETALQGLRPVVASLDIADIKDPYGEVAWSNFIALLSKLQLDDMLVTVSEGVPDGELIGCARFLPEGQRLRVSRDRLAASVAAMEAQLSEGAAGTMRMGRDPYQEGAISAALLGEADSRQVELLIETANDRRLPSSYCLSAIRALLHLDRSGLLPIKQLDHAVALKRDGRASFGFWDGDVDLRIEDVWRSAVHAASSSAALASLTAATRDSNREVRAAAVELAVELPKDSVRSGVIDSIILSALYDPAKEVKSVGAGAAIEGRVSDETLARIAVAYLEENWRRLPTLVKSTAAQAAARSSGGESSNIRRLARDDDSLLVRLAAEAANG